MCIHTCIHAYMHACIHAYIHTYIHAYIHACMHAYIHNRPLYLPVRCGRVETGMGTPHERCREIHQSDRPSIIGLMRFLPTAGIQVTVSMACMYVHVCICMHACVHVHTLHALEASR